MPLAQASIWCELGKEALLFPSCPKGAFDRGPGSYCVKDVKRFGKQVRDTGAMVGYPNPFIFADLVLQTFVLWSFNPRQTFVLPEGHTMVPDKKDRTV